MRKDGKLARGAGLFPVGAATMIRLEGNKVVVTDGPFAETKEANAGFSVADREYRDEAIACAKRLG